MPRSMSAETLCKFPCQSQQQMMIALEVPDFYTHAVHVANLKILQHKFRQ